MPRSLKEMMEIANQAVPRIEPVRAQALIDEDNALVVDVRDPQEVQQSGKVKSALNVSRGMLEFRADPDSPMYDPTFDRDRPVIVYCASGGRSALAGWTLRELGYESVYNLGGFRDWADAGLEVEPA